MRPPELLVAPTLPVGRHVVHLELEGVEGRIGSHLVAQAPEELGELGLLRLGEQRPEERPDLLLVTPERELGLGGAEWGEGREGPPPVARADLSADEPGGLEAIDGAGESARGEAGLRGEVRHAEATARRTGETEQDLEGLAR